MTDVVWYILSILWYIFAVLLMLAWFLGIYLVCSLPGFGLLKTIRRRSNLSGPVNVFAVALVRAVFFAPAVILGHSPFIVTVFAGAIVYSLIDGESVRPLWLTGSAVAVFIGSIIYDCVRSNTPTAPDRGSRAAFL